MEMYRHFKGGIYSVLCVAQHHDDTDRRFVIYQSNDTSEIYSRPFAEFHGMHESGVKRMNIIHSIY